MPRAARARLRNRRARHVAIGAEHTAVAGFWLEARVAPVVVIEKLARAVSRVSGRAAQWAAATDRPNFALPVFIADCKAPTLLAQFKRCDLAGLSEDDARARLAAFLAPATRPTGAAPFDRAGHRVGLQTQLSGSRGNDGP